MNNERNGRGVEEGVGVGGGVHGGNALYYASGAVGFNITITDVAHFTLEQSCVNGFDQISASCCPSNQ